MAAAVQGQGNGELATMPSAEAPVGEVSDGNTLALQAGGEGRPPHEQVVPVEEKAKPSPPERPQAPSRPARTRTRRSKQAMANGQGSGAPAQMAQDHPTPDDFQSKGEAATSGHPIPPRDEEAVEPAADATHSSGVSVHADRADSVSVELARCGWCGGTQFFPTPRQSGRMYCECGSVYNPSTGHWAPGRPERRHSPPAPLPVTAA
jgi:hypothetical protein